MRSATEAVVVPKRKVERIPVRPRSKLRKYLPYYLSIAPYYVVFLAFGIVPIVFSIYLAFQRWDGIGRMQFVGFNNFYLGDVRK
jgi:cellobiose transport system permease protein